MSEPLLSVKGLTVSYGGVQAVKGIDFHLDEGEQVTLIGANGAGKTSTLRAITGLQPGKGEIRYAGQSLAAIPPWERMKQGLVMVPEGRGVFKRLTVLENLKSGAYLRRDRAQLATDMEEIFSTFPRLAERRHQTAGLLSGGEQQMLAMGRALLSKPRLLILDEPSMGLAPIMVETIFNTIARLSRDGMTLLLVEQNARLALQVTQRACVLESGTLSLQGPSASLLDDDALRKAYLGE